MLKYTFEMQSIMASLNVGHVKAWRIESTSYQANNLSRIINKITKEAMVKFLKNHLKQYQYVFFLSLVKTGPFCIMYCAY